MAYYWGTRCKADGKACYPLKGKERGRGNPERVEGKMVKTSITRTSCTYLPHWRKMKSRLHLQLGQRAQISICLIWIDWISEREKLLKAGGAVPTMTNSERNNKAIASSSVLSHYSWDMMIYDRNYLHTQCVCRLARI